MARTPVPGPIVIPSAVQANLYWVCEGRTHRNVLHGQFSGAGAVNAALAQSLFTSIATGFTSSGWAGFVENTATFSAVGVKDLRTPNQVEFLSVGAALPGTSTQPGVGAQTAIVVTQRTAQSGRAFRGRSFLGCLAFNALANAFVATGAADSAAIAFMTAVMNAMAAQSMPLGVAQRALLAGTDKQGNPLPPRTAAIIPVTQVVVVNPRLDTQRRRLGR